LEVRPDMVTLVPEKRQEITTEGGLDVLKSPETIAHVIKEVKKVGIFVSIFVDPSAKQIEVVRKAGADMVEIHTGMYANARSEKGQENELIKIREAVEHSDKLGLRVAAGHGLNYTNVRKVSTLNGIEELNIGHSIIANAVIVGIETAVRNMVALCR
jgi:pyridoxine 5-phosphate synthase